MNEGAPQKKTPEEIAAWRAEHADELNKANSKSFALNPDGSLMDMSEATEEDWEAKREASEENRS